MEKEENAKYNGEETEVQTSRNKAESGKTKNRVKKRVFIPIFLTIMFIFIGVYCLIHSYHYQETDDATIEGHIASVAPKVSGYIIKVNVDDNQPVEEGDIIAEINPADYKLKLAEVKGKLAEAQASLKVSDQEILKAQTYIDQFSEELGSTNSKLDFAKKDYKRYSATYKVGISSKQDYDSSKNNYSVATSNNKAAKDKLKEQQIALQSEKAKKEVTLAQIEKLKAEVGQAELFLSYTHVKAQQSGNVTSKNVEKGNFVEAGQPLMAIVPEKMWLIANFKETQLTRMKVGQEVNIKIDAYPNVKFKGRVDSIQRATGAKASLFPPENAVGSYVKVVQRVPVKITFEGDYSKYNIVPGMSVVPEVRIR